MGRISLSLTPENASVVAKNRRLVFKELLKGREIALKLKSLLLENRTFVGTANSPSTSPEQLLLGQLEKSLTHTLSVLTDSESDGVTLNKHPADDGSSPAAQDRISQDSGESVKRSVAVKDRRGCYKRRKKGQYRTEYSATATSDDGCAWRKYGQKKILDSKYPRSYFRCSHKYDKGCQAQKQVQRIGGDKEVYQTIYIGVHTCKDDILKPMQADSVPNDSFPAGINHPSYSNDHQLISSTIKQEYSKEETSDVTDNFSSLDTGDWWSDLKDFGAGDNTMNSYCTDHKASHNLAIDFGAPSIPFETDFGLDES